MYGAGMLASHAGRQHNLPAYNGSWSSSLAYVDNLTCIAAGDDLYVWHYDRQGAIQCSALNFIHEFLAFLCSLC
jgi:hypothetical protein